MPWPAWAMASPFTVTPAPKTWRALSMPDAVRTPTHGFVGVDCVEQPSMLTGSVTESGEAMVMFWSVTPPGNPMVSVPGVASACWVAARNVQTPPAVRQAGLPVLASGSSPVEFTVIAPATPGDASPSVSVAAAGIHIRRCNVLVWSIPGTPFRFPGAGPGAPLVDPMHRRSDQGWPFGSTRAWSAAARPGTFLVALGTGTLLAAPQAGQGLPGGLEAVVLGHQGTQLAQARRDERWVQVGGLGHVRRSVGCHCESDASRVGGGRSRTLS